MLRLVWISVVLALLITCRPSCDQVMPWSGCDAIEVTLSPGERYEVESCPCGGEWEPNDALWIHHCEGDAGIYVECVRSIDGAQFWIVAEQSAEEVTADTLRYRYRPQGELFPFLVYEGSVILTIWDPALHPSVIAAADDSIIVAGQSVHLTATVTGGDAPYTYAWSADPPDTSLGSEEASWSEVDVTPLVPTTYTVTVTDADQETASDDVYVYVGLHVMATADPDTIWDGGSSQLEAIVEGGEGPYTYTWSPLEYLSNHTIADPVATLHNTQTFLVTASDPTLGPTAGAVTVTVYLRLMMQGVIGEIEQGESADLGVSVYGGLPPYTYDWSPGATLDDSTAAEVVATPSVNTIYTVEVSDAAGQRITGEMTVYVSGGGEQLVACYDYEPAQPEAGVGVHFNASCTMGAAREYRWWYDWSLQGGNGEPDDVFTSPYTTRIFDAGSYYVRLQVSDALENTSEFINYLYVE